MTTVKHQNIPSESDQLRETLHRRMLSSVSHDLKTPLATIIGSLEVYQRMHDKLSPEKKESLINSALGEAYRLDSFITNILDMAKLESGAVIPRAEWCDLNYILSDCVTRLGPKAAQADIVVRAIGKPGKSFVDPMLLARAASLIIDNAIKYGNKTPISVEYGDDGDISFVRIRDHGTGIPEGKEEAIFSKYTRFNHADYQNAGTGLGLPAARQLMYLLGGDVQGKNDPNGGAVFTLSYPHV